MLVRQRWVELFVIVGSGATLIPLYISLLIAIFTDIVVHYEGLTVFGETHGHAFYIVGRS